MKTKRIISSVAAIAMALTVNNFTASAVLNDHGTPYVQKGSSDVENAKSKPVIRVSKMRLDDANGRTVTVTIELAGDNVDEKYSSACFHVYWDDRLTVVPNRVGQFVTKVGEGEDGALCEMGGESIPDGTSGAFLYSSGNADKGYTGKMWTINLQIPSDAKGGDVYPIDVCYVSNDGKSGDIFTNYANDEDGKMMQDYFFLKGINSAQNPSDDPYLYETPFADGYIAVYDTCHDCTTQTASRASTTTTTAVTTTQTQLTTGIFGDINGDNIIDGRDATALLTYYAKTSTGYTGSLTDFIIESGR